MNLNNGDRRLVDWNTKGQLTGVNKVKFSTYIGSKVKRWVPITTKDWTFVSNEQKDAIWEGVLGAFILPLDKKDWVIRKAHELWKAFKRDLAKKYMYDMETGDLLTDPPEIYDSYITEDQWTAFLQIRHSDEFKVKSDFFRKLSE